MPDKNKIEFTIRDKSYPVEKMCWEQYEQLTTLFSGLAGRDDIIKQLGSDAKAIGASLMADMPGKFREALVIATGIEDAVLKKAYAEEIVDLFQAVYDLNGFVNLLAKVKKAVGLVVSQAKQLIPASTDTK